MKIEEASVILITIAIVAAMLSFMLAPGEKQMTIGFEVVAPVVQAVPVYRNIAPVATFSVLSNPCGAPCTVHLNASGSYDPDGSIVRYEWDFGDGVRQSANRNWINHPFTRDRMYQVTLIVVDNRGATSRPYSQRVIIQNQRPTACFTYNEFQRYSDGFSLVELDASCSSDDVGIVWYSWTFPGCPPTIPTTKSWRTMTVQRGKLYYVDLTVCDNKGFQDTTEAGYVYVP